MRPPFPATLAVALAAALGGATPARAGDGKPPTGKALRALAERYLAAGVVERAEIRAGLDRDLAPLAPAALASLRDEVLAVARKAGPRLELTGSNFFYEGKRGKYIASIGAGKTLFLGLHGGGVGAGDAESAASAMAGGKWSWIYPEVLEKTERGWTTSGTEEFVLELVEAAKRTGRVDPDRVYVTGHSMGGYGAWTLGAHHADVFAGVAAYAGAPAPILRSTEDPTVVAIEEGVLPSYFVLPLHVYQSLDDLNVPPAANQFATKALGEWKKRFPGGFDFRYVEVNGRGHGPPEEGYQPSLRWVAEHARTPRPKRFLWQPVLLWKRQMFWASWERPEERALLEFAAPGGNVVEVTVHEGSPDVTGLSVLLGEPLVDLSKEVVVRVNGVERFRGVVPRTLSTLLLTVPRNDPALLYDARVDL
jgi:hypothetical protein